MHVPPCGVVLSCAVRVEYHRRAYPFPPFPLLYNPIRSCHRPRRQGVSLTERHVGDLDNSVPTGMMGRRIHLVRFMSSDMHAMAGRHTVSRCLPVGEGVNQVSLRSIFGAEDCRRGVAYPVGDDPSSGHIHGPKADRTRHSMLLAGPRLSGAAWIG